MKIEICESTLYGAYFYLGTREGWELSLEFVSRLTLQLELLLWFVLEIGLAFRLGPRLGLASRIWLGIGKF